MRSSKAWKELDVYDRAVYEEFKAKYNGKKENSRNLSLTYAEMEPLMSWGRFKKSIDRLISRGFIDLVEHRPHSRDCTIYGLSNRWHHYGTGQFVQQERATLKRPGMTENWEQRKGQKNKTL